MEDVLNQQAEEGWEPVTGFERTHEALQMGSTTGPIPGLVSMVLVFKRADSLERPATSEPWAREYGRFFGPASTPKPC
jgi:hypothetical protein